MRTFSGKGFAENTFPVEVLPQDEYDDWVKEVQDRAEPITEKKFTELLEPGHLGRSTYTGTHLEFMPPPGKHSEHNQTSTDSEMQNMDSSKMPDMDMNSHDGHMEHSNH